MVGWATGAVTAVVFAALALPQGPPPARVPQPPNRPAGTPGRPPEGAAGPWNNDIVVYRSDASGLVVKVATFPRAGVSTLARLTDSRVMAAHQHFPADSDADFDKVAVRFSSDDGNTWTAAQVIRLTGLPDGMRFPFDPTLLVLPDGRIRLYFTSLRGRRFDEDTPSIFSAISTNGIDFVVEPGQRFGIAGRPVIDCAVALHDGVFHLFAPDNGASAGRGSFGEPQPVDGVGYHATSRDGLAFTRVDDVRIDGRRRWLGGASSDGRVMTFIGTGAPGPVLGGGSTMGRGGGWMATSRDGAKWDVIAAPVFPGADPGAVPLRNGGWIVSVTGPPRGPAAPKLVR